MSEEEIKSGMNFIYNGIGFTCTQVTHEGVYAIDEFGANHCFLQPLIVDFVKYNERFKGLVAKSL